MTAHPDTGSFSRRRFLAGASGTMLYLPWLESVRHTSQAAEASDAATPPQRLAFFYLPNGIVRRGFFPGESARPIPAFAGQNNVWRFEG